MLQFYQGAIRKSEFFNKLLNDHPDVRREFGRYHIESTDIRYTVGGGKGSEAREVFIFSWDVTAEPAGLF